MKPNLEIKTKPVKVERVSPREYLSIPRSEIKTARFVPPKLGSKSFGSIRVEYKHLKYKPVG